MALEALLDTRFYFSFYSPENKEIANWSKELVRKISRGEIHVSSSVVTIVELYNTMGRTLGRDAIKIRVASIKASNVEILSVTEQIAHLAGEITLNYPNVPLADAIIAATAFIHTKSTVITDDEHFKQMEGLKTKWLRQV